MAVDDASLGDFSDPPPPPAAGGREEMPDGTDASGNADGRSQ
jgi:hypothetical protein